MKPQKAEPIVAFGLVFSFLILIALRGHGLI